MINQLKKSCYEVFFSIGGYRLQERALENQLKKEVRRLVREKQSAYRINPEDRERAKDRRGGFCSYFAEPLSFIHFF